jgi:hypothetical protein
MVVAQERRLGMNIRLGLNFMSGAALIILQMFVAATTAAQTARDASVVLIVGAPGAEEYGSRFAKQMKAWQEACAKAQVPVQIVGEPKDVAAAQQQEDFALLASILKAAVAKPSGQLWLVWIGHGTYDGRDAKFNLRGPDVSSKEVAEWLKPLRQELVMIQCASASEPFLTALAGPKRVIVTATKGADEVYYARFGEHFAPAIGGLPEADLDQDHQVSVLEAFLFASKKTAEFYVHEDRLATEHALIEDNGDGTSTRAEVFVGIKPAATAEGVKPDGARAAQIALVLSPEEAALAESIRAKRDALEVKVEALKAQREKLGDDKYYAELEKLLRELAALYIPAST